MRRGQGRAAEVEEEERVRRYYFQFLHANYDSRVFSIIFITRV